MKKHQPKPVESMPDFPKLEEELLKSWYKSGIVEEYLHKNDNSKKYFSFLDGPITANNPMGVHHGWGRTYKDLWQRFYNMQGFKQRFQNGFDSQGLWVEVEVERQLEFRSKKDIEKYGVAKFVQKCKDRVNKYSKIQTEQSKRLGYFMDWDNSYFTMSDENNYMIWYFLKVCHENNWLYKGKGSVPWCPRCQTAISQHEMLTEDYKEVVHDTIYLALPIIGKENEHLLFWTTTPWTIPANIAVAVDKDLDYALVKVRNLKYWVAQDLVKTIFAGLEYKVLKKKKGSQLVGLKYKSPFDNLPAVKETAKQNKDKFHLVIPTDARIMPITISEGTGIVHTAVSAGSEDFKLGKKLGLPMIPIIADNASYLSNLGFLSGKNAKKHPELILDYLSQEDKKEKSNWVFKIEKYKHRYPACWRCKEELVWKVTDEWYIAMDKGKPSLRERMKKVAKQINWIPGFGLGRELDWLNNMHDWLISKKNRYWGLCLPIWECNKCDHFTVIGSKQELKEHAIEGWEAFDGKSPHKPQIDLIKIKCNHCGNISSRIEPVGNPWLDAGIVTFSTISKDNKSQPLYLSDKKKWRKWFPADFITESFPGQFKNWFYSLIAMSAVLENKKPMKTVLGFATLLAEDGRPMHKSWGNMIEFYRGAQEIGVDVMRWMFCRQDPKKNLLFGHNNASMVKRQFHLILWNSYRFVVNNFENDNHNLGTKPAKLNILDHWILSRLNTCNQTVTKALTNYDPATAVESIENLVQDFSTWYIRRSRNRVGPVAENKASKKAFYQTSTLVLITLSKLLAPFTPFISDLIFTNLTGKKSVHLTDWPSIDKKLIDKNLEKEMQTIRDAAEKFHSERKISEIKLRQPLAKGSLSTPIIIKGEILSVLKEEINVEKISWKKKSGKITTILDKKINSKLKQKGEVRNIIRKIQQERKRQGATASDPIIVMIEKIPKGYKEEIRRKTLAKEIIVGKEFKIEKTT